MKIEQVAVTLYTVRDFCGTSAQLAETARKVRAIGYRAIQHPWTCPVPAREVVKIMANEGSDDLLQPRAVGDDPRRAREGGRKAA